METNNLSEIDPHKHLEPKRPAARTSFLTWRAKESIALTEALAEQLEIELAQFAKQMRALH